MKVYQHLDHKVVELEVVKETEKTITTDGWRIDKFQRFWPGSPTLNKTYWWTRDEATAALVERLQAKIGQLQADIDALQPAEVA